MKIPHLKAVLLILTIFASFLLVLALLPQPNYTDGFKTIGDLQTYAATLNEFEKSENESFLCPSYESYYQQKFSSSFGNKLKAKVHGLLESMYLARQPAFSPDIFHKLLTNVTQKRKHEKWYGNFVQKIDLNNASKIVVFGTLQGSFHPLSRYLSKLKELNIIDENFKVITQQYYLVFMGNLAIRSPHSLETLTLILKLLKQNPYNVICLRGSNEHPDSWKTNTLGRELEYCAPLLLTNKNSLDAKIDDFFNTLPITLYCATPSETENTSNFFKITPFVEDPRLKKMLDENLYQDFLYTKNQTPLSTLQLAEQNVTIDASSSYVALKAIITDIKKRDAYEPMNGLRLLPPTKGVVTWTVLSSSAELIRTVLKFFYDAFVIITPTEKSLAWNITLYNRDIRNVQDSTFYTTQYDLFSGEKNENIA